MAGPVFRTWIRASRRVLTIVQTMSSPAFTVTDRGPGPATEPRSAVPLRQATELV
jgi:hypothetical protein